MKRLTILLLILSATSCSKKKDTASAWLGVWKWESSCGGIAPGCEYPTAGNFGTISFASNEQFTETHNNVVISESKYFVKSANGTTGTFRIEENYSEEWGFEIANDLMTIHRGEVTDTYSRVK